MYAPQLLQSLYKTDEDLRLCPARAAIKALVKQKGIPYLVHFTPISNLESILTHGILSRKALYEHNIPMDYTDNHRLDGRLDASSISIAFPNEKMFYKKRVTTSQSEWAVILLKPDVLWEKMCAFYPLNAADNKARGLSLTELQTPAAFEQMFYADWKRQEEGLCAYDPTDVQAEVMIFDTIEPAYISTVAFCDIQMAGAHQKIVSQHSKSIENQGERFFKQREWVRKSRVYR